MPVHIQTGSGRIAARHQPGDRLTDIAASAGIVLNTRCAGNGICGGCMVHLGAGEYEVNGRTLRLKKRDSETALACQTLVLGSTAHVHFPGTSVLERDAVIDDDFALPAFDPHTVLRWVTVEIPVQSEGHPRAQMELLYDGLHEALEEMVDPIPLEVRKQLPPLLNGGANRIVATLMRTGGHWHLLDLAAAEACPDCLGVAVDMGTTTVAALLIDLRDGRILGKASMYNQQIRKADDVASRISYGQNAEAVRDLQSLIVQDTINPLIAELCANAERSLERILYVVVSGNTVMSHLFFGVSPLSIGHLPFQPAQRIYEPIPARNVGLHTAPHARVEAIPSIAGYVGGDITADIYVTGLHTGAHPSALLIDVGTNGEMVYRQGDRMAACATAAGPAFEGYGLTHGCRGSAGAIEHITFDERMDLSIRVIGGQKPIGLCGSAIIDFIACGRRCGLLNRMGRYNEEWLKTSGRYLRDTGLCGGSLACVVVPEEESAMHGPIVVTEQDIAQVLKAKAAIYAGMTTLLEHLGRRVADLDRIYLAGGFARHISLSNAITIGLFPELPLDRYVMVGNGSLAGAYLAMADARAAPAFHKIIDQPTVIELNRIPSFESHFIDALALPNFDETLFPSVEHDLSD